MSDEKTISENERISKILDIPITKLLTEEVIKVWDNAKKEFAPNILKAEEDNMLFSKETTCGVLNCSPVAVDALVAKGHIRPIEKNGVTKFTALSVDHLRNTNIDLLLGYEE
jgi:hypothetical protein